MPVTPPTPSASHAGEAARAPLRRFGRFELRALLGKCSRSMSWLVFDPRAAQELVLMLPRVAPANQEAAEQWQRQIKLASRLSHPHLAHVIDIGQQDQWPFVTYDRAAGETLEERLKRQPAPPATELAAWICQALEGLAFAHEAGFSHRGLQLSSLLINEADQVRVAGLEVAPELAADTADASGGSIGGVSSDRRRRQRDDAEGDLVAIGILMQRVLSGQNVLDEPDVQLVQERMFPAGRELVRLPWGLPQPVAEALRAIVNRATDRQPRQRYHNARTLHRALDGWRADAGREGGGPIALLLERMGRYGHLPAMPGMSERMRRVARMEQQHTSEVSQLVLQDIAMSFELLRNVNSVSVRPSAGSDGPVLNMKRAIAMLGLNGVHRASAALREWPGPLNDSHAEALMGLMERVQRAGEVAQALRPAGYDPEVIYLIALMQNLGRLLVQYHFPDDALQIRQLMQPPPATPEVPNPSAMTETAASYAVLGIDISSMATAAAHHWGLPEDVLHLIRRLAPDAPIHTPENDGDHLRLTASLANDVVDALLRPTVRIAGALEQLAKRYGRALGLGLKEIHEALGPPARPSDEKNAKN
jgi:HD-like signal output (HDOD) protein